MNKQVIEKLKSALRDLSGVTPFDDESEEILSSAEIAIRAALAQLEGQETTPPAPVRLTDEELEQLRQETFSTGNPFCPCDKKTFWKGGIAVMHALERKRGVV